MDHLHTNPLSLTSRVISILRLIKGEDRGTDPTPTVSPSNSQEARKACAGVMRPPLIRTNSAGESLQSRIDSVSRQRVCHRFFVSGMTDCWLSPVCLHLVISKLSKQATSEVLPLTSAGDVLNYGRRESNRL